MSGVWAQCGARHDDLSSIICERPLSHAGEHVGVDYTEIHWPADDPPEYDPYDAAADQAEDHAAAQAELSRIEAEEARGG